MAQVTLSLGASEVQKLNLMAPDLSDWDNGYTLWRENKNRLIGLQTGNLQSNNSQSGIPQSADQQSGNLQSGSQQPTNLQTTIPTNGGGGQDRLANIPVGGSEIRFRCTCQRKGLHEYPYN